MLLELGRDPGQVLWWHEAGGEGAGGVLPPLWSLVSAASGGGREGGPEIPRLIPYGRVRCLLLPGLVLRLAENNRAAPHREEEFL